jgi:D-alanyl-D-alanine carboxypeptidase
MIFLALTWSRVRPPDVRGEEVTNNATSTPFVGIELEARAAIVWDVERAEPIFVKNEGEVLPLASLTKVMTAIVASEAMPRGPVITIAREALGGEGDQGLMPGERWLVEDLIDFTLISSSNDGALALAGAAASDSSAFVRSMNSKAGELTRDGMFFLNPTGLDTTGYVSGGYGSAHDMAALFSYSIKTAPEIFESTTQSEKTFHSVDGISHYAPNTNTITERIPWLMASKTGFTDLAGGNLAIAMDAGLGRPVVIVVLGSTQSGRFRDVEKLIPPTFAHMSNS